MSVIRSAGVAAVCAFAVCLNAPAAAGMPAPNSRGFTCSDQGAMSPYVVLFERGTSRASAESAIASACGSTVSYYPEIAVAVASSHERSFAERIGPARVYSAASADQPGQGQAALPRSIPEAAPDSAGSTEGADDEGAKNGIPNGPETAHDADNGDGDVAVAVLDSGISAEHPELDGAVADERSAGCLSGAPVTTPEAWGADGAAHGTHVAGIIAGARDGSGVSGVAPGARIASVKVITANGETTPRAVVCGLMWAAEQDMAVANSSFTLTAPPRHCVAGTGQRVAREAVSRAVAYAASRGTVTVAAATNHGWKLTSTPGTGRTAGPRGSCGPLPASLPETVTVSALNTDGVKAGYSSYGLGVIDVAAPGGGPGGCVLSAVPGGYERLCGTSMAAAHVSGALARIAAAHPGYSAGQLTDALTRRADALPCPADYDLDANGRQDAYCAGYTGYNGFYGHGAVRPRSAASTQ